MADYKIHHFNRDNWTLEDLRLAVSVTEGLAGTVGVRVNGNIAGMIEVFEVLD